MHIDTRAQRRRGLVLVVATLTLSLLVVAGVIVERSARTPLVQVGQVAPGFSLPSTNGGIQSLAAARGRPLILAFVPSVQCDFCRAQLRALQAALPDLHTYGAAVFAVSADTPAVQRAAAAELGLAYPLLSEGPTVNQHPVGSAYGVYHLRQRHPGPVDANAIVVIDANGIVRAVRVRPGQQMSAANVLDIVDEAIGSEGGAK